VARLRRRYPHAHRWIGRCYVLCCLIAGVAAYPVAFGTLAGPVAAWGFACMASAWLATTLLAFVAIRRGRVAEHRRWMVLSFALTLSAVTLRVSLLVPFFFWLEVMPIYRVTAWTSWIGNLLIALLWLRNGAGERPGAPNTKTTLPSARVNRERPSSMSTVTPSRASGNNTRSIRTNPFSIGKSGVRRQCRISPRRRRQGRPGL
jgi:uncharacterized membrane protein